MTGRVHDADPARYESLPPNESRLFYLFVRHATVVNGPGVPPFIGDLGIAASHVVVEEGGRRSVRLSLRIEDLGDLRVFGALETIDATGLVAAPLFGDDLQPGHEVTLPSWTLQQKNRVTLEVGQPAGIVLLRPIENGRYRVERVLAPVQALGSGL